MAVIKISCSRVPIEESNNKKRLTYSNIVDKLNLSE